MRSIVGAVAQRVLPDREWHANDDAVVRGWKGESASTWACHCELDPQSIEACLSAAMDAGSSPA
jgi:hypothetical protein